MADLWTAVVNFIVASVLMGTTLMYGTLGEIITEKSGNMNLGVEGLIYMGGAAGLIAPYIYEQAMGANAIPAIGMLIALAAGFLVAAFGQPDLLLPDDYAACQPECHRLGADDFRCRIWQIFWRVLSREGRGTAGS